MKRTQQLMLNERNNHPNPDPFYIFLTSGAGVGNNYLLTGKSVTFTEINSRYFMAIGGGQGQKNHVELI